MIIQDLFGGRRQHRDVTEARDHANYETNTANDRGYFDGRRDPGRNQNPYESGSPQHRAYEAGFREGSQQVGETHDHDIASLQKHFGPDVAFDAASHGPAQMQRKDRSGQSHQLTKLPSGRYQARPVTDETSDYAQRRRREEDIISGQAQPRKKAPAQTSDYARRRAQEKKQGMGEETQRLDPKCWTGYKKQGTKMKGGVRVNNCVPRESVKESLSWSLLDPGLSIADKMTIFEDYHTNGNLTESTQQDNKDYFVSLVKLADNPAKNQKYIVVPMALIRNRVMTLDQPQVLTFVGRNTNGLEFESDSGSVTYPSKTIRELAVYNTFTFGTVDAYDKFRTALALKFDTELPTMSAQVQETTTTNPREDPYNRGYFDALSLTKRSQSPYQPGSDEDRQYHAGFESGYAERREHYS
jgi:hypothetical protein